MWRSKAAHQAAGASTSAFCSATQRVWLSDSNDALERLQHAARRGVVPAAGGDRQPRRPAAHAIRPAAHLGISVSAHGSRPSATWVLRWTRVSWTRREDCRAAQRSQAGGSTTATGCSPADILRLDSRSGGYCRTAIRTRRQQICGLCGQGCDLGANCTTAPATDRT